MARDSYLNIRLESDIKEKAETILGGAGLSLSDAVRVFLCYVVNERGIPFYLRLPNEESKEALKQVRSGELTEYDSLEEMIKDAETW